MKIEYNINCYNKSEKNNRHHIRKFYRRASFYLFHKYNTPTYPNIRNGTNGKATFLDHFPLAKRKSARSPAHERAMLSSSKISQRPRLIPKINIIQLSPYPKPSFVHLLSNRNTMPMTIPPIHNAVFCPQLRRRNTTAATFPTIINHTGSLLVFISSTVQINKNIMTHTLNMLLSLKLPIPELRILFSLAHYIPKNCDICFPVL